MKILIIEDSQQIMETVVDYLELEGLECDCAYDGQQALLVFKDNADDYLDGYEMRLHATAVVLALSGIIAMLLASLMLARRLSRPLHAVTDKIRDLSPGGSTIQVDAPYSELQAIEKALSDAQQLVATSLRREREFSRFASHEIRTPLTVIKGSSEYLARAWLKSDAKGRAVARIEKASGDMAILIETFLLLGRSELIDEQMTDVNLASLVVMQPAPFICTLTSTVCPSIIR